MSSFLAKNVGTIDRAARIVVGVGAISLAFVGPQTNWGFLGLIPLATAAMGSCPVYSIFGLSTCPMKTPT